MTVGGAAERSGADRSEAPRRRSAMKVLFVSIILRVYYLSGTS